MTADPNWRELVAKGTARVKRLREIRALTPTSSREPHTETALRWCDEAAEDLTRLATALERLGEAAEQIASGSFPGASTMAVEGRWHEGFNRLQEIARQALHPRGEGEDV